MRMNSAFLFLVGGSLPVFRTLILAVALSFGQVLPMEIGEQAQSGFKCLSQSDLNQLKSHNIELTQDSTKYIVAYSGGTLHFSKGKIDSQFDLLKELAEPNSTVPVLQSILNGEKDCKNFNDQIPFILDDEWDCEALNEFAAAD